ncbi:unnamed protein product [Dracunculus medinensis]|uniref:SSD domain-containing protein n=1 Tax=Dracunculus medinensis TaxID=318479 RepID=A0A3P7PAK1_DRAME|nr:unnamed protein product [Dracunculus medinensis]
MHINSMDLSGRNEKELFDKNNVTSSTFAKNNDDKHLRLGFHNIKYGFLRILGKLFLSVGYLIASFPYVFIIFTLLLSMISYGVIYLRFAPRLQDGFTSRDAPSHYEEEISFRFSGTDYAYMQTFVALIQAADGGNMLRPEYLTKALEVHKYLNESLIVNVGHEKFRHTDICGQCCGVNKALQILKVLYEYSVAQHLFGVKKYVRKVKLPVDLKNGNETSTKEVKTKVNTSSIDLFANENIEHVALIMLLFYAVAPTPKLVDMVTSWEEAVFEWTKAGAPQFPELRIDVFGDKVLSLEMFRGGLSMMPYLFIGLCLSVMFVMLSVIVSSIENRRIDFGKILIVIGIILSPLLAVFTTFGMIGLAQVEIYPIQMVIPFLILAIGVDDAFLMLHAWKRQLPTYDHLSIDERYKMIPFMFGKILEEVGPSITITSLTNAIAFGVGSTISTPAIQLFCLAASIAMVMDFTFELTFFGAFLSLAARFEKVFNHLLHCYCQFITMNMTRLFILIFILIFFTVSLIGTLRVKTYINAQKIIPYDSPLLTADTLFKNYHWKEYEPLQIYVNRPPNISDSKQLAELKTMIEDFESLPQAIGSSSTIFWLYDLEKLIWEENQLMAFMGIEIGISYDHLPRFLEHFTFWQDFVRWSMDPLWRDVADRWQKFNVTIYSKNAAVYEGIFQLKGTTIQTAAITLVCMLIVCMLFIPSVVGILTAGWAICSISLGVFGFLSWWGLDLDPVTMSAIVMSIGFSVDYTAHVSYHYQRSQQLLPSYILHSFHVLQRCIEISYLSVSFLFSKLYSLGSSKTDRLIYTMDSVGLPMIQAAISTLICFLPIAFHPDYIPSVFIRAIALVVGWGLLHGLVLLPAILTAIPDCLYIGNIEESASFSWQKTALENLSSHKSHFTFGKGRTLWLRNINEI